MRVILVTGASSGIGKETAIELKKRGYVVYGAARRVEEMKDLRRKGIHIAYVDVTNEESMHSLVHRIMRKEGRIDVLINNAGYGSFGAIEDVTIEEARKQLDVNLFGLARMTQLVLPQMRNRGSGKIVNISSAGGKLTIPFGGWYHATKFAVEAFSDCLRLEVAPLGVDVILIEPGGIRTKWGEIAASHLEQSSKKSIYHKTAKRVANLLRIAYGSHLLSKPVTVAKKIGDVLEIRNPKARYLIGMGARTLVFLKGITSDKMYDKIVSNITGMNT